jgi:hypothetical protein
MRQRRQMRAIDPLRPPLITTCRTLHRRIPTPPHPSKTPRQLCFLAGPSGPAQYAIPSRRVRLLFSRTLQSPLATPLHQSKIPRHLASLAAPSGAAAQHAIPSRRAPPHQSKTPRQPSSLAAPSEAKQCARPSRQMRVLSSRLPHVHGHVAQNCHLSQSDSTGASVAASSSFPGSRHHNHTALPHPPTQRSLQHTPPVPLSSACRQSSSSRSPSTS